MNACTLVLVSPGVHQTDTLLVIGFRPAQERLDAFGVAGDGGRGFAFGAHRQLPRRQQRGQVGQMPVTPGYLNTTTLY